MNSMYTTPVTDSYPEMLRVYIQLTEPPQQSYFSWLLTRCQRVKMKPSQPILDKIGISSDWVKQTCRKKHCFYNAAQLCIRDQRISYVEGTLMMDDHINISHAWNCFEGKHFDVTGDLFFPDRSHDTYWQLIRLKEKQLFGLLLETKHFESLISEYYRQHELNS